MSAYMMSTESFEFLAAAACRVNLGVGEKREGQNRELYYFPNEFFQAFPNDEIYQGIVTLLREANIQSLEYAYPAAFDGDKDGGRDDIIKGGFRFQGILKSAGMFSPSVVMQIAKTIDCFIYQSCEHPDFYQSRTYQFLISLKDRAINNTSEYRMASWGEPNVGRIDRYDRAINEALILAREKGFEIEVLP